MLGDLLVQPLPLRNAGICYHRCWGFAVVVQVGGLLPAVVMLQITLTGHVGKVYGVQFLTDNKVLASTGTDKTIKIWDLSRGACAFWPSLWRMLQACSGDRLRFPFTQAFARSRRRPSLTACP